MCHFIIFYHLSFTILDIMEKSISLGSSKKNMWKKRTLKLRSSDDAIADIYSIFSMSLRLLSRNCYFPLSLSLSQLCYLQLIPDYNFTCTIFRENFFPDSVTWNIAVMHYIILLELSLAEFRSYLSVLPSSSRLTFYSPVRLALSHATRVVFLHFNFSSIFHLSSTRS